MSHQEAGKARLAKEHDPGLWIFKAQVTGERGGEDKIAENFVWRMRIERTCVGGFCNIFVSGTGAGSEPGNWAETMSGFGAVTRSSREFGYKSVRSDTGWIPTHTAAVLCSLRSRLRGTSVPDRADQSRRGDPQKRHQSAR
ncbi:hypothetical protein NKH23_29780 [Mesorhizobium sp. M1328]|uniref:hypothetical protein n=1 Tax=Mesorhizobium sp. M1328 TaxID=2957082 RepID=UPI0033379371